MNENKFGRIREFLRGWGYTPDELNAYIRQVAPKLEYSAERARHDRMNGFFAELLGRKPPARDATPVPPPGTANDRGLGRDIWIMLGTGNDPLCMEDLADYYAEHISRLQAQREQKAATSMNFSRMLHGMDEEERKQQSCADLIERHERIVEESKGFNMSTFLQKLETGCDSTPRTLIAESLPREAQGGGKTHGFNEFLRKS